jgi:hypothetical protein
VIFGKGLTRKHEEKAAIIDGFKGLTFPYSLFNGWLNPKGEK